MWWHLLVDSARPAARNHGGMLDINAVAIRHLRQLAEHDFQRLHALFRCMHDHVAEGKPVQTGNVMVDMARNYDPSPGDVKV